jgi:hypothetical protein
MLTASYDVVDGRFSSIAVFCWFVSGGRQGSSVLLNWVDSVEVKDLPPPIPSELILFLSSSSSCLFKGLFVKGDSAICGRMPPLLLLGVFENVHVRCSLRHLRQGGSPGLSTGPISHLILRALQVSHAFSERYLTATGQIAGWLCYHLPGTPA